MANSRVKAGRKFGIHYKERFLKFSSLLNTQSPFYSVSTILIGIESFRSSSQLNKVYSAINTRKEYLFHN